MAGSDVEGTEKPQEGHQHVSDRFGHDSEFASFMALGPQEGLENDEKRWQTNPLTDLNKWWCKTHVLFELYPMMYRS